MQKRDVDSARKRLHPAKTVRFQTKTFQFSCHCEERSDVAILKLKVWHSVAKHGSMKQRGKSYHKKIWDSPLHSAFSLFLSRFCSFQVSVHSKVLFRSALPYFVTGWQTVPFKIAASGARALLAMTNLVGFAGKRSNFRNEMFERRCGAIPRKKRPQKMKNVRFPNKNAPILCHCEERSDAAILKFEAWHPGTKHGNRKRQNPEFLIRR